ncbi:MAG TPA: cytochrome C oxidase, partial [Rhabdaerophilum sp.]|nr:cytochrome C oxidase [Rhabdaerophilum sp.]
SIAAAALAVFSVYVASQATDSGYAFHAYVFALAGIAAVIAIGKRAVANVAVDPPQEINGKPNYNMGPVKFTTIAAMF